MWNENIFGEQMGDEDMGTDEVGGKGAVYEGPVQYPGQEQAFRTTGSGKAPAANGGVRVVKGAGRSAIMAMQEALIAAGCPETGAVDGIIGPRTRAGMQCFINRYGHSTFAQRFPAFVDEPTKALGTRQKTPSQRRTALTPGAPAPENGGLEPGYEAPLTTVSQMAGDWRIWAAAGGVLVLGYAGYRYYKDQKRKEIFRNIMDY